jgi:hypothetical protein
VCVCVCVCVCVACTQELETQNTLTVILGPVIFQYRIVDKIVLFLLIIIRDQMLFFLENDIFPQISMLLQIKSVNYLKQLSWIPNLPSFGNHLNLKYKGSLA